VREWVNDKESEVFRKKLMPRISELGRTIRD
jgi:hypothetical protein